MIDVIVTIGDPPRELSVVAINAFLALVSFKILPADTPSSPINAAKDTSVIVRAFSE